MNRLVAALVATAVLLGATVVCEKAQATLPREDPLGRQLLYLPSPEMLRLASLGNPGLVADLVYLWSIQYYSQFQPHERFLYLETVFNLITDLDPLYHDAYRVGALIMQLPTGDEETHKRAVVRLFDKALDRMPANHEIAETAAWDMVIRYHDFDQAIRYVEIAIAIPGSPHRLKRALAAWRDKEVGWSFEDALAYWDEARQEAASDYDTAVCDHQIYRLFAARDEEKLNPILMKYAGLHGGCPDSWQKVVDVGWVREVPVDYFGNAYQIVPESCSARAIEGVP